MNDPINDNLESRLEALTRPPTEPAALWRAALEEHRAAPAKRSIIARIAPWAGLAAVVAIVGLMFLPARGAARRSVASSSAHTGTDQQREVDSSLLEQLKLDSMGRRDSHSLERSAASRSLTPHTAASPPLSAAVFLPESADAESVTLTDAFAPSPRLVARRANLSLRVPDVREAFLKAQHTPSPALGEFVQDSKITGEGAAAAADLTLRVAPARLASVLNELRALGALVSENSIGDDVTNQAVDLDARLRNERRVEEEVLQLLESRKDAPLADVLKLRETLSTLRGSIERMDAQRATITRMVDLATVILILRPAEAPPPPPPPAPPAKGFLSELEEQTTLAFSQGSRRFASSLASVIEHLVGGALTWLALAVLSVLSIGIARRLLRFASYEPAPRLHG